MTASFAPYFSSNLKEEWQDLFLNVFVENDFDENFSVIARLFPFLFLLKAIRCVNSAKIGMLSRMKLV